MIQRKIEVYLLHALSDMQLIDGVIEFLQKIKSSKKYRFALTTSGRKIQQEQILKKLNLSDFFQIMITSDDVKNGKPHPEPYVITVKRLGEKPSECLVIEDSDNGILSAKAAGCLTCGITTTFAKERLKSVGADLVISNFSELEKILF